MTPVGVLAGEAGVTGVKASYSGARTYAFHVTVKHVDTGWDHYADKWDVVAPGGTVLGTRTLYHPHVSEQPFTRSLSGGRIPDGITTAKLRAHDKIRKYGRAEFEARLDR